MFYGTIVASSLRLGKGIKQCVVKPSISMNSILLHKFHWDKSVVGLWIFLIYRQYRWITLSVINCRSPDNNNPNFIPNIFQLPSLAGQTKTKESKNFKRKKNEKCLKIQRTAHKNVRDIYITKKNYRKENPHATDKYSSLNTLILKV